MIANLVRLSVAVVVSSVQPLSADSIRVEGGPWQSGAGGEFKITTLSGFAGVTGRASDTLGVGTFQSFCLERNALIATGPGGSGQANVYNFTMNSAAVTGGYGGGNPDPISAATAYLFTQFRDGLLAGYMFSGSNAQRQGSAEALQIAIWTLEDEYGGAGGPAPVNAQASQWVAAAHAAVAGTWGNTVGLVRALNLSQDGNGRQDVLTLIPLPPAAWMGLAGLVGVTVMKARRRVSQGSL